VLYTAFTDRGLAYMDTKHASEVGNEVELEVEVEVEPTIKCIYCFELKPASTMTLEHIIPQCLGGNQAPERYKVKRACRKCNSHLGLFVDASFEKSWLVSSALAEASKVLSENNPSMTLPLTCMGQVELAIPGMLDSEVVEWWFGAQGEHVFLIRPVDERLYWFMGGNPITMKGAAANARAYYFFNGTADAKKSLDSFKDSFHRRKVKKVTGTVVEGANLKIFGFSEPDELDNATLEYLWANALGGQALQSRIAMHTEFDVRFVCKIALGMSFALFGEKMLATDYAKQLNAEIWRASGEESVVFSARPLNSEANAQLSNLTCEPGAISILVLPAGDNLSLSICINQKHIWTIKLASMADLDSEDRRKIEDGLILMLFRGLNISGREESLPEYLHNHINSEGDH
jgi:hypothetical protein